MAIIELVDRDVEAKKVDIKKKPEEAAKPVTESKVKATDKKTKSKKQIIFDSFYVALTSRMKL